MKDYWSMFYKKTEIVFRYFTHIYFTFNLTCYFTSNFWVKMFNTHFYFQGNNLSKMVTKKMAKS